MQDQKKFCNSDFGLSGKGSKYTLRNNTRRSRDTGRVASRIQGVKSIRLVDGNSRHVCDSRVIERGRLARVFVFHSHLSAK